MAATENLGNISAELYDYHRAVESLREEIEAVSFYKQRAEKCQDAELKNILLHNAKEEKEHFAMLLEWIRRQDKELDKELNDYLFKEGSIGHE